MAFPRLFLKRFKNIVVVKVFSNFVIASRSSQWEPPPYEDHEPSKSQGRLFLLSIPDLIRDPEGRRDGSSKKIILGVRNGC
jgi:hypothetical protein